MNNKLLPLAIKNNSGAMFGIDARISIAIFAAITVAVAALTTSNIGNIYGQALADELKKTTEAVEGFHADVRKDVFRTLAEPDEEKAYMALYDPDVLKNSRDRSRWLGPYIKNHTSTHVRYGDIRLTKKTSNHINNCGSPCYLWLTLENTPENVALKVDEIFDQGISDDAPEFSGRIQWEDGDDEGKRLWYRVSRAIN